MAARRLRGVRADPDRKHADDLLAAYKSFVGDSRLRRDRPGHHQRVDDGGLPLRPRPVEQRLHAAQRRRLDTVEMTLGKAFALAGAAPTFPAPRPARRISTRGSAVSPHNSRRRSTAGSPTATATRCSASSAHRRPGSLRHSARPRPRRVELQRAARGPRPYDLRLIRRVRRWPTAMRRRRENQCAQERLRQRHHQARLDRRRHARKALHGQPARRNLHAAERDPVRRC